MVNDNNFNSNVGNGLPAFAGRQAVRSGIFFFTLNDYFGFYINKNRSG